MAGIDWCTWSVDGDVVTHRSDAGSETCTEISGIYVIEMWDRVLARGPAPIARGIDLDECAVRDRRHRAGSTEHGREAQLACHDTGV